MRLDIILRLYNLVVCLENEALSQNICLAIIEVKCRWKARFRYCNEKISGNKEESQHQPGYEELCVCVCVCV